MTDTIPNTGTVMGSVNDCAASVRASGEASAPALLGSAAAVQPSAKRPNTTSPATAHTESWKPRSKPIAGDHTRDAATAAASPAVESLRLPPPSENVVTAVIRNARIAEGAAPVPTTYSAQSPNTNARLARMGTPTRVSTDARPTATTTRCDPLTATKWLSPVVRKSASSGVSRMRL